MKLPNPHPRERGAALWIAMLLIVLLGSASALRVDRHTALERDTQLELARLQAFHAAEGALELARHHLARGEDPPRSLRLGGCEIALRVRPSTERARVWVITARALLEARTSVSTKLESTFVPG